MVDKNRIILLFTLILWWKFDSVTGYCKIEGETCTKTIFAPCCQNSTCHLSGLFKGICVKCLPEKSACLFNSECCTGKCNWFRCIHLQVT
ncbi:unnamed protein product [Heterobilharzia americana]|nr:unnamed protein product [Heterobilharzia americana]CAH8612977.1 unnamed protein product [Heterobilharzia americana]